MGKKVLISGGSRGIGAATVRAFHGAGDTVTFLYKNSVAAAEALCRETGAVAVCADVSDPAAVRAAVDSAADRMGGIDVLVCNAGIAQIAQICDIDDAAWRALCDTNLSAAFYLCREVSRYMVQAHRGRIITVGSVWGRCGASCEVAYSAAKAGIRGLTMALAKELGPSGITVNCVEPGVIATEMNASLSSETLASLSEEIPLSRLGNAEEVASVIAFLASDAAAYITAQCIGVDGGFGV